MGYKPTPLDDADTKPYDPEDEEEIYDPEAVIFDEKKPATSKTTSGSTIASKKEKKMSSRAPLCEPKIDISIKHSKKRFRIGQKFKK